VKLQPDPFDGVNAVNACDSRQILVNQTAWTRSVLIPATGEVVAWEVSRVEELGRGHFSRLPELSGFVPEIIVFGSGDRLRFVAPALLADLHARRIGVETMTTQAACRTYNLLAQERRKVLAALLMPEAR
jgi:uncharacterized protein